jgi:F0F1-type ATP synthase membrane subunit b/b'
MQTLVALQAILIKSIPTFILVWILYWYTNRVFLGPLQKVLRQREESTEGLRKAAADRISLAERKTAEYQETLRAHSADIYRQQEQDRLRAMEHRAEILRLARQRAEERIGHARQEILQEAEDAKKVLQKESEQMAQWIMRAILEPPAAGPMPGTPSGANPGMTPAAS